MKGTWSDFVVHEIRQRNGVVVQLTGASKDVRESHESNNATRKSSSVIRFVLCKMGMDTISAIRVIADFCGVPFQMVIFFGNSGYLHSALSLDF